MSASANRCLACGAQTAAEKIAPVQGYSPGIPWSMHLRAYAGYCQKWGAQHALIDLEGRNCRGGFSTGELDGFIPGWLDELSENARLKARIAELEARHGTSDEDAAQRMNQALPDRAGTQARSHEAQHSAGKGEG